MGPCVSSRDPGRPGGRTAYLPESPGQGLLPPPPPAGEARSLAIRAGLGQDARAELHGVGALPSQAPSQVGASAQGNCFAAWSNASGRARTRMLSVNIAQRITPWASS